eukprot:9479962-Pyramimonas_sp.AAC.2
MSVDRSLAYATGTVQRALSECRMYGSPLCFLAACIMECMWECSVNSKNTSPDLFVLITSETAIPVMSAMIPGRSAARPIGTPVRHSFFALCRSASYTRLKATFRSTTSASSPRNGCSGVSSSSYVTLT